MSNLNDLPPVTAGDEAWAEARYQEMFALAWHLHAGQKDKGGAEYILHLHYVAHRQLTYVGRVIALLHDSLEDGKTTPAKLKTLGVPVSIIARIERLSHRKQDTYSEYVRSVMPDVYTREVKKADLEHNMTVTRLPHLTRSDQDRLLKYHTSYRMIQEYERGL